MHTTVNDFLAAVKRRCFWPTGTDKGPFTDAQILSIADEEMKLDARPLVHKLRGGYDILLHDLTVVANQEAYRLPDRIFTGLRDVVWVDPNGAERPMVPINPEDAPDISTATTTARTAVDCRYYLHSDALWLVPVPSTAIGKIRLKYAPMPALLVKTSSNKVAQIATASWSTTNLTTTLTITGGGFTPTNPDVVDVVSAGGSHPLLAVAQALTGTGPYTLASSTGKNPLIQADDYLCDTGYTPYIQLPEQATGYFLLRVAYACLQAHKDYDAANAILRDVIAARREVTSTLKPRDQSLPKTLMCRNSPLRSSWRGRG